MTAMRVLVIILSPPVVPPKESSVLKGGEHEDDNDVITSYRLPFRMECFTPLEKTSVIAARPHCRFTQADIAVGMFAP